MFLVAMGCGDDEPSAREAESTTTTAPLSGCDDSMIIYFEPTLPDAEVAKVLPSIEEIVGVVEAEAVTQAETYEEFREIFADSPQLIETVTADILPPSIKVRVDQRSALDEVERQAESLAGFHEVLRGEDALSPAMEEQMAPDQLERWCNGGDE